MKNWRAKLEPFLTHHLWCKFILKFWAKFWEQSLRAGAVFEGRYSQGTALPAHMATYVPYLSVPVLKRAPRILLTLSEWLYTGGPRIVQILCSQGIVLLRICTNWYDFKSYYTGYRTKWNRTKRRPPVLRMMWRKGLQICHLFFLAYFW